MTCVSIFVLFLFRTCEQHTEHMDQHEMEQHMQRMETRIRQEVCFTAHLDLPVHCIHKYLYLVQSCPTIQWLRARVQRKSVSQPAIRASCS